MRDRTIINLPINISINQIPTPNAYVTFSIGDVFIQDKNVGIINYNELIYFKHFNSAKEADNHWYELRKKFGEI